MLKLGIIVGLCVLALLFFGCASSVEVTSDYDQEFDFSKLKTFGFLPIPESAGLHQLDADRVSDAVKADLTPKGYALSKEADFAVVMHFGKQRRTDIQSWGYGWGEGSGWRQWGARGVDVYQYEEGTLVLDVVDMKEKKLIWRGSGTGILSDDPGMRERTDTINKVVKSILAKFPPRATEATDLSVTHASRSGG
jgi:hypothetical protein